MRTTRHFWQVSWAIYLRTIPKQRNFPVNIWWCHQGSSAKQAGVKGKRTQYKEKVKKFKDETITAFLLACEDRAEKDSTISQKFRFSIYAFHHFPYISHSKNSFLPNLTRPSPSQWELFNQTFKFCSTISYHGNDMLSTIYINRYQWCWELKNEGKSP